MPKVRHKIVVLGAAKVGKTSLINQFLYNRFVSKYKRTVEEMHTGTFHITEVSLTLDILDTSGAYEVRNVFNNFFSSCNLNFIYFFVGFFVRNRIEGNGNV